MAVIISPSMVAKTVVLPGNSRIDYFTELLELTLSYSREKNYEVSFIEYDVPKLRAFKFIEANEGIDLIAAGYTNERASRMRVIPLPILKGLNGWRIPLVTMKNANLFNEIKNETQFKRLRPGQMLNWSDTKVIESNNIEVVTGIKYYALFEMLAKDRFDYFPRSILEIESEYERHKDKGIVIEPNIIIHYPTAYVYYVNQQNTELAQDLAFGLESAYKDGKFDVLFNKYYGHQIEWVRKQKRKKFELNNPFLPTNTPLARKELWLDLAIQK